MANENQDRENNQQPSSGRPVEPERNGATGGSGEALPPKRVFSAWIALALIAVFLCGLFFYKGEGELKEMDQVAFRELVEKKQIDKVELVRQSDGITYLKGVKKGPAKEAFRVNVLPTENLDKYLQENQVPCKVVYSNNVLGPLLQNLLWLVVPLLLLYFIFIRQMRNANMGAMNFGKSRAKLLNQDKKKVTFANVAGIKEAKEEVQEIVEFLRDPKKFQKLGGKIPKGVLLMGPPGTGKTLLAKAIAGEAGVPFFSISGSDFVEMFVGVGASRVRDMFDQGKKHAPCLIFIDEIDAVGRSRFSGIGGGHDEREQTLNAMLVEMDGFDTNEGVIIIAATNRADVLVPALLRPGRFDRQIVIDLPSLQGREEILKLHAAKILLSKDADLARIARGTPGFSGADLANLLNEAALLAARENKPAVDHHSLEEARDKVLWGRERRSLAMDEEERACTAWHESGHALLQVLCEHTEPLHKVTIIPRGQALGVTMSLPEKDVLNRTRAELLDELVVLTGGRIAEERFTGDISTGAQMDIKMASGIARKMICAYGMSETFGFQAFGENQETLFMGREVTRSQNYSEETARKIDAEIARMLQEAYARASRMLDENADKLKLLAETLLEAETLDGRDVEALIKTGAIPEKPADGGEPDEASLSMRKEVEEKQEDSQPNLEPPPIPPTDAE
ncbi:MAG: ATP-dependent zinc metalloprotease FtsH [Kiritimatiellae bacterium]|nr:ATP-dependent zinc metalloprotease FtsH [Kiritimatiellia bacterium]